jgi:hypothetical protein
MRGLLDLSDKLVLAASRVFDPSSVSSADTFSRKGRRQGAPQSQSPSPWLLAARSGLRLA